MATGARESSRRSSHNSDRKRQLSPSTSASDSESDRRHRKKEKKRKSSSKRDKKHDKKKKKKKRSRERDERSRSRRHRENSASDSSSDSENESNSGSERETSRGGVDHERAGKVVRTLLVEFPSISSDLLGLLQMLDDGETAVISGIANARVKTLLGTLFPLLGLKKLRKPADAFIARSDKRSVAGGPRLLETVATMLTSPSTATETDNTRPDTDMEEKEEVPVPIAAGPRRHEAPIGPMMPPTGSLVELVTYQAIAEDDDDDEIVGPALPGMKGFRVADERVEAEMARRAKQLEEDEWRRARGEAPVAAAAAASGGREAWMTEMPANNKIFNDAMGPMKARTGQPAAFRSKEPAKIDSTWFDSPEERERGKRAKLDVELLGYVRPENAPAARSTDHVVQSLSSGPSVNESILPAANPEADDDMRRQMEVLKQKRGPSLLEQHQQKIAHQQQKSKAASEDATERTTWNRDRDLTSRRGVSQGDADRIIKASQEIGSKFTAPTVTRQFL